MAVRERKQTPFRLPDEVRDQLELFSSAAGVSMNTAAVEAITSWLDERRADPEFRKLLRSEIKRREEALKKVVKKVR